MKIKTTFFALSALFILIGNSLAFVVMASPASIPDPVEQQEISGEVSGDESGELAEDPSASGESSR